MATLCRAAVMLSVLVGLPAAWIYYGPLPSGAQRVVDRFVTIAKDAAGWKETAPQPRPTWDFTRSAPIADGTAGLGSGSETGVAGDATSAGDGAAPARAVAAAVSSPSFGAPLQIGGALPPAAESPEQVAASLAERVEPWLTKLREFGVAEYALERWGGDGKLYRFHCEMPIVGSPLTQQFEAVAANPESSVEQVVAEVSKWRTARQAAGM